MDDSNSRVIAREAAKRHGQQSLEPRLIRSGANHVYAIGDIVVRVARSDVNVSWHLAIGGFLRDSGVPVPDPIGSGEIGDNRYSVWEHIRHDASSPVDYSKFGVAIRALHEIDLARLDAFDLPWCDEPDWLDIDQNLISARAAKVVPEEDIDLLETHAERLRSWGDRCRAADRHVLCHGDVHPQNVLMRDGQAIIIDWDTICVGPPQWDHAALLTWADRWGGQASDYDSFAEGYGDTFDTDPFAMEMAEMRLLAPTINMILKAGDHERYATEARRRMRFWRNEPDAPAWSPQ